MRLKVLNAPTSSSTFLFNQRKMALTSRRVPGYSDDDEGDYSEAEYEDDVEQ